MPVAMPARIRTGISWCSPTSHRCAACKDDLKVLLYGLHTECAAGLLPQESALLRRSVRAIKFRITDCHHTLGILWTRHPQSFSIGSVCHNTDIDIRMDAAALQAKFGVPPVPGLHKK